MIKSKINIIRIAVFFIMLLLASCNIFSPEYEIFENVTSQGDNSTIEGLMKNFVYSYTFKDSFLYEDILDEDFIFEFDNEGVYESWTKNEDVRITKRMFRNFDKIDLVFNSVFPENTSQADTTIFTSFKIDFYSNDEVVNLTGFSKFIFIKRSDDENIRYYIKYWEDLK